MAKLLAAKQPLAPIVNCLEPAVFRLHGVVEEVGGGLDVQQQQQQQVPGGSAAEAGVGWTGEPSGAEGAAATGAGAAAGAAGAAATTGAARQQNGDGEEAGTEQSGAAEFEAEMARLALAVLLRLTADAGAAGGVGF